MLRFYHIKFSTKRTQFFFKIVIGQFPLGKKMKAGRKEREEEGREVERKRKRMREES